MSVNLGNSNVGTCTSNPDVQRAEERDVEAKGRDLPSTPLYQQFVNRMTNTGSSVHCQLKMGPAAPPGTHMETPFSSL